MEKWSVFGAARPWWVSFKRHREGLGVQNNELNCIYKWMAKGSIVPCQDYFRTFRRENIYVALLHSATLVAFGSKFPIWFLCRCNTGVNILDIHINIRTWSWMKSPHNHAASPSPPPSAPSVSFRSCRLKNWSTVAGLGIHWPCFQAKERCEIYLASRGTLGVPRTAWRF